VVGFSYIVIEDVYITERRVPEAPILEMFLCKNLPATDWYIGIDLAKSRERATRYIKRDLGVLFTMEIIKTMSWYIWKERNKWIFNEEDPLVLSCMTSFKKEFILVIHRTKQRQRRPAPYMGCSV
jgi:hypothetical protein